MVVRGALFPALLCFLVLFVPATVFADDWAEPAAPGEELTVPADRIIEMMQQAEAKIATIEGYYSMILIDKPGKGPAADERRVGGKQVRIWRWFLVMARGAYACRELYAELTGPAPEWQDTSTWWDGSNRVDLYAAASGSPATQSAAQYHEPQFFPVHAPLLLPLRYDGFGDSSWLRAHNARFAREETVGGLTCVALKFRDESGPEFALDSTVWVCPERGWRIVRLRRVKVRKTTRGEEPVSERLVTVQEFERHPGEIWLPKRVREDNFSLVGERKSGRVAFYLADDVQVNSNLSDRLFRPFLPPGTDFMYGRPLKSRVMGGDLQPLISSMLAGNFSFLPEEQSE